MNRRRFSVLTRLALRRSRVLQIGVLAGFWWIGDLLARGLGLPLPGAVLGLAALLALLASGRVPAVRLRRGAGWLLAEMLLFVVPAMMALLDYGALLRAFGLELLAVIVLGTALVMAGTALAVDAAYRWRLRDAR